MNIVILGQAITIEFGYNIPESEYCREDEKQCIEQRIKQYRIIIGFIRNASNIEDNNNNN